MKGAPANIPDTGLDPANVQDEELSTNQEATVIPWVCGESKLALRWISPPYNQFTIEAPMERPGKK